MAAQPPAESPERGFVSRDSGLMAADKGYPQRSRWTEFAWIGILQHAVYLSLFQIQSLTNSRSPPPSPFLWQLMQLLVQAELSWPALVTLPDASAIAQNQSLFAGS